MPAPLILIAEDDPDQSELICNSIVDAGFRIVALQRGNEVLSKVEELSPDLVIMDIRLPGLNGMQVLTTLRQSAKFRTLPVILVSAYYSAGELEKMMNHGASSCLSKPFEIDELLSEVHRLVGAASGKGDAAE